MSILTKVAKVKKNYFSDKCVDMLKQNESDLQKEHYHLDYLVIKSGKVTKEDLSRLNMLIRNGYKWVQFK